MGAKPEREDLAARSEARAALAEEKPVEPEEWAAMLADLADLAAGAVARGEMMQVAKPVQRVLLAKFATEAISV